MKTILIIEDERALASVLKSYLERDGFNVLTANRGDTGFDLAMTKPVDLVLLDLNLPGMDGIDIARQLVEEKSTPIIMVTARVEELDKLKGLEIGADDYITKPFSPREVVARVKAVLRRVDKSLSQSGKVLTADLEIDQDAHTVKRGERLIELTPSEYSLLLELAQNPGRVYSRLQLLTVLQGQAYEGYERTIDAHIKNLRAKVENDPRNPELVKTVFGVGYKFSKESE